MRELRRILIRLPNWLGDALLARPLAFALRRRFPAARIVACGPTGVLELLGADHAWNEAVALPGDTSGVHAPRGCDAAILCPPSFSSAWLALRWGARRRIGFRGDARDLLLTDAVPRPARGDLHLSQEYLLLAARVDAAEVAVPALVPPSAREGGGLREPAFAILAPGALYGPAKRWPAERFVAVGRALIEHGLEVRVAGSSAEREECEQVAAEIGRGARTTAGATRLVEQADACARARVVVANDSGLDLAAAAVGAATVVVFGSTSSAWTAPLGPRVRVVQRPPACSPCFRRTCAIGYRCFENIRAREVIDAALEFAA